MSEPIGPKTEVDAIAAASPRSEHTSENFGVDSRTFAIGVLSITACILFVGVLFLATSPTFAVGMNDRAGDYLMVTQQLTTSAEGLLVIDAASNRMILYHYDFNMRRIQVLDVFELNNLRKRAPAQVPPVEPGRRGR